MSLTALLADILFVGHSLIGPTLPGMVERAAAAQNVELRAEMQIINGSPLKWNWENSHTAQGVDGRRALESGRFEHLVITEAIPLKNHLDWSDSHAFARTWAQAAKAGNGGAQVWVYETWHSLESGTGRPVPYDNLGHLPWRGRLADDWANWKGIATAAGPGVRVIPAGQAMGRLADEIGKGTVPGLRDIRDVFSDDIHLNDRGLYLVAMVMHAAITGRDPRGLPAKLVRQWQSRATVTDAMARRMQEIAWDVVQARRADADGGGGGTPPAAPPGATDQAAVPLSAPGALPPDPQGISEKVKQPEAGGTIPESAGVVAPGIGFGLAEVADWSVAQPFLDVMKTARPWIGHLPGQWGGWGHEELAAGGWLDAQGWPLAVPPELSGIATLILTDLPDWAAGVAGRYVLTHQGRGTLKVEGRATVAQAASGRVVFDYTPGQGGVLITIAATDRADPIRAIRVVRQDREALLDQGEIFNPDWLARIQGARLVRFMDWMRTNGSSLSRWEDRPRPDDYTWTKDGVPVEVMLALANRLQAHPWFTIPHLAEDALVRGYAEAVRDGLDPGLVAHVEYSNEVWNLMFPQARWAEDQAAARWNQQWKWVQFYALRAVEVADIWADVFRASPDRLVRVLATQTGWKGLEADILTAPLVMAEGRPAPYTSFDAYAVTGYFAGAVGQPEHESLLRGWLAAGEAEATARALEEMRDGRHSGKVSDSLTGLVGDLFPYHARVAQEHGLRLMMYEGGTHVVAMGPMQDDPAVTGFLERLNYDPGMGALYRDLVAGWQAVSDAPFNAFVDVMQPSRWGSWGALRHLGDDNPRWRALARGE
jgi:hypothetical protein